MYATTTGSSLSRRASMFALLLATLIVCLSFGVSRADAATFAPTFDQTFTTPVAGADTGLTATITKNASASNIKQLAILESPQLAPNFAAFGSVADMCPSSSMATPTSAFNPASCPAQAKVGTITITSPSYSHTATGNVYLIAKSPIPWFGVSITPSSAAGNPAGLTSRFALVGMLAYVNSTCDPNVDFCQQQLRYTTSTLPNIKISKVALNLNGPSRTGSSGTLSGKLFKLAQAPCVSTYTTKAVFTPVSGAAKTVTDSDSVSGCAGDTQPPTIQITNPVNGSTTTSPTATLAYTASDNSGVAPTCTPANGTVVTLVSGPNPINVVCTDGAGNSGSATTTVTYTPPTLPFNPTFNQTSSNQNAGQPTTLTWAFGTPAGNATIKRIRVFEPKQIGVNLPAFGAATDMCPSSAIPTVTSPFDSSACPAQARVGTATVTTSSGTLSGAIYLVNRAPLPWFGIDLGSAKLTILTSIPQADPACDNQVEFCDNQLLFTLNIPASMDGQFQLTLGGAPRTGSSGTIPGQLFQNQSTPCTAPAPVKAEFTSQADQLVNVFDPDPINGCV